LGCSLCSLEEAAERRREELVSLMAICLQIKRHLTVVSSSMSRAGQGSLASLEEVGDTSDLRGARQKKRKNISLNIRGN
jgi:hypothetical protein